MGNDSSSRSDGPAFRDHPHEVVLDVTDIRFRKIVESRDQYTLEPVSGGSYIVRKDDSVYYAHLEKTDHGIIASCNCPDWRFHSHKMRVPCKHIWLIVEDRGLVSFPSPEDLPPKEDENAVAEEDEGAVAEEDEDAVADAGEDEGAVAEEDEEVEEIDIPGD